MTTANYDTVDGITIREAIEKTAGIVHNLLGMQPGQMVTLDDSFLAAVEKRSNGDYKVAMAATYAAIETAVRDQKQMPYLLTEDHVLAQMSQAGAYLGPKMPALPLLVQYSSPQ
ncbi:MAG: hypothetical protein EPN86_00030 [Nanoarchaeota archaeon]|nr:MAG: hypothetical protein EPN86_00030 [Nanoarchaeota archaeon]